MPWRPTRTGIAVRFRLTPRSSKEAVEGIEETAEGPAFKARVRAVPEDGAANAALEKLVAQWLGVARRDVKLSSGAKSRIKVLAIDGGQDELVALLVGKGATLKTGEGD